MALTTAPSLKAEWLARGFVAVLAVFGIAEHFLPLLLREDRYTGDLSQHVWWTARFADPGVFPDDFIADFFSLPLFAPPGYQAIYRLAVPWADPQTVAEAIPFVLGAVLVAFCWRAGRAAAGGSLTGAVLGGVLALRLLPFLDGGLPRAFALPLLAMGLAGLLEHRLWLLGLSALLASLCYPPITVNLGLTAAVVLGIGWLRTRELPRGWRALAALGALALLPLLRTYNAPLPEDVGPRVTAEQARAMPEFGPDGRSALFHERPLDTYFGATRGGYGLPPELSLLLTAVVAVSVRRVPGAVPLAAWALLGTGLAAHALAWLTLFTLHLPSRYTIYALPLFILLWLSALSAPLAAWLVARWPRLGRPAGLGVAALLFLALWLPDTVDDTLLRIRRPVYESREHALDFLRTLPEDARIASHPEDANAIPLRTRRSALASKEVALPYYLGFYTRLAERLEAELRAFYAFEWEDVEALHDRYGVDVMLVSEGRFVAANREFDEPFATHLRAHLGPGPANRYVLRHPPADRILFRRLGWTAVRLGPPRPGYESIPVR